MVPFDLVISLHNLIKTLWKRSSSSYHMANPLFFLLFQVCTHKTTYDARKKKKRISLVLKRYLFIENSPLLFREALPYKALFGIQILDVCPWKQLLAGGNAVIVENVFFFLHFPNKTWLSLPFWHIHFHRGGKRHWGFQRSHPQLCNIYWTVEYQQWYYRYCTVYCMRPKQIDGGSKYGRAVFLT